MGIIRKNNKNEIIELDTKNHVIILKALIELKDSVPYMVIVVSGSDKGLTHVKKKIKEFGLIDNVKVSIFLPNIDL